MTGFFIIAVANASDPGNSVQTEPTSDQELLDELMSIVDESTKIATKTRMNSNSIPGTLTVLQGKEMAALGARTAWDALALVPGFLPTKDPNGGTSVIARGLSFPFSSGNIKILVNSLSMSRESSGINSSILQIPIEQIKRIEIVRGPGAILYGDNALMGLVNIITKTDEQQLFTRIEGNGAISGGATGAYDNEHLKIYGNMYVYDNNSTDAPNNTFAEEDRQFGVFSLNFHGFSLNVQSYHRDFLPTNQRLTREGNDIFSAKQQIEITPTFNTELNVSYLQNDFNLPGINYNGDKIQCSVDLNWTGLKNHQWWFRFTYTDETIDDALQTRASPPGRPPPPPLMLSDVTRKYYSLSLQDQIELTDSLTFTASLRFDHRDDLDREFFLPRLSAVWRVTDEHILKAQYAEGFRVPTFFELYTQTGRLNLNVETIATSELNYIYHQAAHTGKITLFYSKIDHMLFPEGRSFGNAREAESMGVEAEWEQKLTDELKWQANLSFVDSWDTRTANGSKGEDFSSTSWLSNVVIFYQPIDKVLLAAHWHYTGQRDKTGLDVAAENRLGLTLNVSDFLTKGLGFKVGLQNVFKNNELDIQARPQGAFVLDYGNKSTVWAQLSYSL